MTFRTKQLSEAIQSVDFVLSVIEQNNRPLADSLRAVEEVCRNVFQQVQNFVDKHSEVVNPLSTPIGRARRIYRRLRWSPEEVQGLQQRLDATTNNLNQIWARLNHAIAVETNEQIHTVQHDLQDVRDGVDEITQRLDAVRLSQHERDILVWLSGGTNVQPKTFSGRQQGTGLWFLTHTDYLS